MKINLITTVKFIAIFKICKEKFAGNKCFLRSGKIPSSVNDLKNTDLNAPDIAFNYDPG